MLTFAYWAGLAGVTSSLALALLAWSGAPFASHAVPYIVLFVSVFITFIPAIMAHPARTRSGTHFSLDARTLLVAQPWTLVVTVLMMLALTGTVLAFSPHGDKFTMETASLVGRLDRQLLLSFFCGAFHACALNVASSGLRWGSLPQSRRARSTG